jgi:hypothetical protein
MSAFDPKPTGVTLMELRALLVAAILVTVSVTAQSGASEVSPVSFKYGSETGTSYDSISGVVRLGLDYAPLISGKARECASALSKEEAAQLVIVLKQSSLFEDPEIPEANQLPYCDVSAPASYVSIQWNGQRRHLYADACNSYGDSKVWDAFGGVAAEKIRQCDQPK